MTPAKTQLQLQSRSELNRFEPYKPGLSIEQIRRQYGLKTIIKLGSNENALGCSSQAASAYKKASDHLFRYPESKSVDLRHAIATRFKVDMAHVILGNGSDEIIELLAKAYLTPKDEMIMSQSAFVQYKSAGLLMGARVVAVPMKNMTHDLEAMAKAVNEKTKLIFIANPNNPTGTYNTKEQVAAFLKMLPSHVLPIFDEAYFEYAEAQEGYPSVIQEFFRKHPVMVLRTFSKIYGLAGLRVGFGVGPESVIATLDKIRPPYNVSAAAQAAAFAAFYDENHIKKSVEMNEKEKKKVSEGLVKLGFQVVPSVANFVLFKVAPLTGRALFQRILQKGVITRSVDEYALPDYLRVTIGTPSENKKFLSVLEEVTKPK